MGLATTATHVIWFLALVGASSLILDAYFETAPAVDEARAFRDSFSRQRLETQLVEARFCWDGSLLSVQVVNGDRTTLDALNMTFLVEGIVLSGFVSDVEGEVGAASVPPGYMAWFNRTGVGSLPGTVAVALPVGTLYPAIFIPCPVLTTIEVTPATAAMTIGSTLDLSAEGFDQFDDPYDGTPYVWESACGTIVPLSPTTARFTAGTTAGACAVNATSGAIQGQAILTIAPDQPSTITVAPQGVGVPAGGAQAFTATARDVYGNVNTTAPIGWTTNAGSITSGGVLTAQTTAQLGRSVTATWTSVSGAATVHIHAAAPSTVSVSPSSTIVNTTLTRQFSVTVYDAYGNVNTTAPVTWGATRGSVTTGGLYTAPATTGADTVTATAGAASGQASVSVQRAIHIDSVTMYKNNVSASSFKRGTDTAEARVIVRDHLGNLVQSVSVTVEWVRPGPSVDHTDIVTSSAAGAGRAYWVIPNGETRGEWTARVALLSGSNMWWNTAADLTNASTFSVTN